MKRRALELAEAEKLLDVIFGVVIALALTKLPEQAWSFLQSPSLDALWPPLLLGSSLVFAAFYWFESRFFIRAQSAFDLAIANYSPGRVDGVRIPFATFLLGTLCMMAVASGVLGAAVASAFRPFLLANILFWVLDCGGAVVLKRTYRRHEPAIRARAAENPAQWDWYKGHILSSYFYLYSGANALFFAAALAGDYQSEGSTTYRVALAIALSVVTFLRHVWFRSRLLDRWIATRLSKFDEQRPVTRR